VAGQDALALRPTILRAFAQEAAGPAVRATLDGLTGSGRSEPAVLGRVREIYESLGVFAKTEAFIVKCRSRAMDEVAQIESEALRELMAFVVDVML